MGGRAGRPLQGADEIAEAPADTGGGQHLHQRAEEHRHHGGGSNSRDSRTAYTGYDARVQYIIGQLNSPVEQLMNFFYSVQDVKINLERINEIHRMDDENGKQGLEMALKEENQGIDLENVNFKYDPHALKTIIDDVSLTIPKGKVTAIVGASGSGKTTLIKLMLGYYPVLGGQITIGGTDVNTLNKKWWRRQCGVVMQDGVIFSESIARNIAVDDGEIDKQRLQKAAEIACIHDYVMGLPL